MVGVFISAPKPVLFEILITGVSSQLPAGLLCPGHSHPLLSKWGTVGT